MSWSILAPAIIVGTALALIVAERIRPYDRQRFARAGLGVDLIGYALVQSLVLALPIRAIVDAANGVVGSHLVSSWPFALQVGFFVILHDFYIYWFHRLQHRNRYLWRVHEAHHSAREVDWIAGSRSHALEIAINQTIELGAMILLGAGPDVVLCKGAISIASGMWIHANIDVHTGWLSRVINGPEMHRWHHAIDYVEPGRNFSTKLAIWDWLFGTAYLPAHKPAGYGLAEDFPRAFFAQQAHAFRGMPHVRQPVVPSGQPDRAASCSSA
jgi:sterol desaturase/sphingolipid hydroxylase (fatty acid hydroxylase superfamily)